jgi:hypothetical protein
MSPVQFPNFNGVMKRFIKTFKNEKINNPELGIVNLTLREYLLIPNIKLNNLIYLRKVVAYIIDHINQNKLTIKTPEGSNHNELVYESTKDLMNKPLFLKAYSKHSLDIHDRRNDILNCFLMLWKFLQMERLLKASNLCYLKTYKLFKIN